MWKWSLFQFVSVDVCCGIHVLLWIPSSLLFSSMVFICLSSAYLSFWFSHWNTKKTKNKTKQRLNAYGGTAPHIYLMSESKERFSERVSECMSVLGHWMCLCCFVSFLFLFRSSINHLSSTCFFSPFQRPNIQPFNKIWSICKLWT